MIFSIIKFIQLFKIFLFSDIKKKLFHLLMMIYRYIFLNLIEI